MRTDFIPALALAAKANAFFRDAAAKPEVLAGHPAFARFHDLEFLRQTGLGGDVIANSSVPWFRRLRNEGVAHVRPMLAGMRLDKGADAPWGLLTEGDRGLELWSPNLGRRFQGHDDLQPLRLTMTSSRFDRWSLKNLPETEETSEALLRALEGTRDHLEESDQMIAAKAVGKYLSLHEMESPEVSGDLASLVPDLRPCGAPLFASAARCLGLLEATGWLSVTDATRIFAEPLWLAIRTAFETAL